MVQWIKIKILYSEKGEFKKENQKTSSTHWLKNL